MKYWGLVGVAALALLVTACQKNAEPTVKEETAPPPPAATTPPVVADPYANDTMAPPADAGVTGKPLPPEAKGGRTHVVQKGDTLYKVARQYYGDAKRWKDIWEANKTRVPNKDKLEVGTKLIIP